MISLLFCWQPQDSSSSQQSSQTRPQVGVSPTTPSANPLALFANLMAEAFSGRQGGTGESQEQQQQPQQQQQQQTQQQASDGEPQISDQMFAHLVQVGAGIYMWLLIK